MLDFASLTVWRSARSCSIRWQDARTVLEVLDFAKDLTPGIDEVRHLFVAQVPASIPKRFPTTPTPRKGILDSNRKIRTPADLQNIQRQALSIGDITVADRAAKVMQRIEDPDGDSPDRTQPDAEQGAKAGSARSGSEEEEEETEEESGEEEDEDEAEDDRTLADRRAELQAQPHAGASAQSSSLSTECSCTGMTSQWPWSDHVSLLKSEGCDGLTASL